MINTPCGCNSTITNNGCNNNDNPCSTNLTLSSNVIYNGPELECIIAEPCDTLNVVLQKIDEIICNLLSQINILNTQVTNIGAVATSQPSFSQYNQIFSTSPVNGELLFRVTSPASTQIKSEIDLTSIKGMNNSIIGGRYTFPDGPDVLAIVITNTSGTTCTADFLLQWAEAQA